jgi:hypothetical protein
MTLAAGAMIEVAVFIFANDRQWTRRRIMRAGLLRLG